MKFQTETSSWWATYYPNVGDDVAKAISKLTVNVPLWFSEIGREGLFNLSESAVVHSS